MENPIKMDDLGVPIFGNIHIEPENDGLEHDFLLKKGCILRFQPLSFQWSRVFDKIYSGDLANLEIRL